MPFFDPFKTFLWNKGQVVETYIDPEKELVVEAMRLGMV